MILEAGRRGCEAGARPRRTGPCGRHIRATVRHRPEQLRAVRPATPLTLIIGASSVPGARSGWSAWRRSRSGPGGRSQSPIDSETPRSASTATAPLAVVRVMSAAAMDAAGRSPGRSDGRWSPRELSSTRPSDAERHARGGRRPLHPHAYRIASPGLKRTARRSGRSRTSSARATVPASAIQMFQNGNTTGRRTPAISQMSQTIRRVSV